MSDPITPPTAPASAGTTEDRTVAILTYVTIVGFIIAIVMHSSKKTALGAFHLRQGLGLFATSVVCSFFLAIPFLNLVLIPVFFIGFFILWLMGLIAAVNGQQKPMPLLGEHYQKWFSGAFA